ncbi:MAG: type II toxin-antitoxin system RelE/ParE family toxin [Pseudomonadota bacterium]
MSYRLVYTQKAVRDIDGFDAGVKKRIGTTMLRFKDNPLQYAERLTDPELGGYRFRIGDYRVIFDIEGNDIVVLRAGHRKEIYKRK